MKSTVVQYYNNWHPGAGIEWTIKKSYWLEEGEEVGNSKAEGSSARDGGQIAILLTPDIDGKIFISCWFDVIYESWGRRVGHNWATELNWTELTLLKEGFPGRASGKELTCQCRRLEIWVQFLGQEDPLEEGMATLSSILAWRIP